MRQTVLNVVGSLPPQYFDVRINTVAESLAQLMLSIMTTGYMLRSAQVGQAAPGGQAGWRGRNRGAGGAVRG